MPGADAGTLILTVSVSNFITVYKRFIIKRKAMIFNELKWILHFMNEPNISTSQATDADNGINSQLAYNITSGDKKHRFQVNNIGEILATDVAVGSAGTVYNLNITATDNIGLGSTSLQPATVKVRILLLIKFDSLQL